MSNRQRVQVYGLLKGLKATEFIHGDCVGADCEAHALAESLGLFIHVYPGQNAKQSIIKRAFCRPTKGTVYPIAHFYVRNKMIVDRCEVLIACPGKNREGGGTAHTMLYAEKIKRKMYVIFEHGSIVHYS
jgi:hypothetical protein